MIVFLLVRATLHPLHQRCTLLTALRILWYFHRDCRVVTALMALSWAWAFILARGRHPLQQRWIVMTRPVATNLSTLNAAGKRSHRNSTIYHTMELYASAAKQRRVGRKVMNLHVLSRITMEPKDHMGPKK